MGTKAEYAEMLLEAASMLDPLKPSSPVPEACIKPALARTQHVWEAGSGWLHPAVKTPLRVAVLAMRSALRAVEGDASLSGEDCAKMAATAATLRRLAPDVETDPRSRATASSARGQTSVESPGDFAFSPRGLRGSDMTRLAGGKPHVVLAPGPTAQTASGVIDDGDGHRLAAANAMYSRLPNRVPAGSSSVITTKMPLLVYPSAPTNDAAMKRAGLSWSVLRDPGAPRTTGLKAAPGKGSSVLLADQVLIGFRREDLRGPSGKKLVDLAVHQLSKRMGPHANPLAGKTSEMLTSPGNSLAWLWLLPEHVITQRTLPVTSVSFPWASDAVHSPISHGVAVGERRALLKELEDLEKDQQELMTKEKRLSDDALRRISEIRDQLGRTPEMDEEFDTPTKRLERQRVAREEMEARYRRELGPKIAQLAELREMLADQAKRPDESAAAKKQRRDLTRDVAALQKELVAGRERIMKAMRDRPRT